MEFAAILNGAKLSEKGEVAEAIVQAMEAIYGKYDKEDLDSQVDPELMQLGIFELKLALNSYRSQAAYALREQRILKKGAL